MATNNSAVSLYRRALVNLLIACTADVRKHPDKSKFAQECIDLVAQVRRNGLAEDEDTEKELKRIEAHAEQTLKRIEVEIKEAEAHATAKKSSKKGKETTGPAFVKGSSVADIGAVEDDEDTEADEGTEKSLGEGEFFHFFEAVHMKHLRDDHSTD